VLCPLGQPTKVLRSGLNEVLFVGEVRRE
jgi:hypothetical protein